MVLRQANEKKGKEKEIINYFVIFGLSAVALVLAIYMDFVK